VGIYFRLGDSRTGQETGRWVADCSPFRPRGASHLPLLAVQPPFEVCIYWGPKQWLAGTLLHQWCFNQSSTPSRRSANIRVDPFGP